jgi:hypothetical protein
LYIAKDTVTTTTVVFPRTPNLPVEKVQFGWLCIVHVRYAEYYKADHSKVNLILARTKPFKLPDLVQYSCRLFSLVRYVQYARHILACSIAQSGQKNEKQKNKSIKILHIQKELPYASPTTVSIPTSAVFLGPLDPRRDPLHHSRLLWSNSPAEPAMHPHRVFPSYCFSTGATRNRWCITVRVTIRVKCLRRSFLDEKAMGLPFDWVHPSHWYGDSSAAWVVFFLEPAFMFQNISSASAPPCVRHQIRPGAYLR